MHFMSHFEHWPEKSRCLFQSRTAADSFSLQPCTLNHSNLVCILDGGEVVSYHGACVTFSVLNWCFLTVSTMAKPKGELKINPAAVPTCGASSLLPVIEQWQRWCFYGLGGEKLSWWLVQIPVCTSGMGDRRQTVLTVFSLAPEVRSSRLFQGPSLAFFYCFKQILVG